MNEKRSNHQNQQAVEGINVVAWCLTQKLAREHRMGCLDRKSCFGWTQKDTPVLRSNKSPHFQPWMTSPRRFLLSRTRILQSPELASGRTPTKNLSTTRPHFLKLRRDLRRLLLDHSMPSLHLCLKNCSRLPPCMPQFLHLCHQLTELLNK